MSRVIAKSKSRRCVRGSVEGCERVCWGVWEGVLRGVRGCFGGCARVCWGVWEGVWGGVLRRCVRRCVRGWIVDLPEGVLRRCGACSNRGVQLTGCVYYECQGVFRQKLWRQKIMKTENMTTENMKTACDVMTYRVWLVMNENTNNKIVVRWCKIISNASLLDTSVHSNWWR